MPYMKLAHPDQAERCEMRRRPPVQLLSETTAAGSIQPLSFPAVAAPNHLVPAAAVASALGGQEDQNLWDVLLTLAEALKRSCKRQLVAWMKQDEWEPEAALAEILLSSWKQRRPELARAAEEAVLRQVMWVHNSDGMVYVTHLRKVLLLEGQVQD